MSNINKIGAICRLFQNVSIKNKHRNYARTFSVTPHKANLMEFFDEEKNWGATQVKSGRSWTKDELRIKSNSDLHKLWYVLLKERNMLLTMEEDAKTECRLFPSPERLDKVEESMENLESVVRERNKAYHLLETGETGERPGKMERGLLGLDFYHKMNEYPLPKHMNTKWLENNKRYKEGDRDVKEFLLKRGEQKFMEKKRQKNRDYQHVCGLLKRFPNMDMEALKQQYPDVDIERAKTDKRSRGNFEPK